MYIQKEDQGDNVLHEKNYGQWTKKIDTLHIHRFGDSKTLCGKPMLGSNCEMQVGERGYCEDCQEVWEKECNMKLR